VKLLTAVFLAGGVALFAWLIARQGLTDVLDAAAAAGWGILAITLFHIVPLTLDAVAWRRLLKHEWRLSLAAAIRIRWLGESVNGLLPAAQIVSELVRVRLAVLAGIPGSERNGAAGPRVPNTSNISIERVESESLLIGLDLAGIAVSSGSACSSGTLEPSHVLKAMGLPHVRTLGSIRFSLGASNTDAEIDRVIETLPPLVEKLRSLTTVGGRK